jgi:hypothetical protein
LRQRKNGNITYQNLWNAAKAVLRGKFTAMTSKRRPSTNNATSQGNKDESKPSGSRREKQHRREHK